MARQERETKTYITWFPYFFDSVRWTHQGWHVSEKDLLPPRWKVLAPVSILFPRLRVTYERIVSGGIWHPEEYREAKQLASELLSRDPSLASQPQYAAFFISTLEAPGPPVTPLPSDSLSAQSAPSMERPVPPPTTPTDVGVMETQHNGPAESSTLPPPPFQLPQEGT